VRGAYVILFDRSFILTLFPKLVQGQEQNSCNHNRIAGKKHVFFSDFPQVDRRDRREGRDAPRRGGVLLAWLLAARPDIPLRGRVILWAVGLVVLGLGMTELLARPRSPKR
jgi:hypothetical protein